MYYFLNINIGKSLTGIEHSALARLRLFKEIDLNPIIITTAYNPQLSLNISNLKENHKNFLNLYDYFQEIEIFNKPYKLEDFKKTNPDYILKKTANPYDYKVFYKGEYILYLHCFENEEYNISYINYFDLNRKKIKREIFDIRGFKSSEIILDKKQNKICEKFFNTNNEVCIEKYYDKVDNEKNICTSIILYRKNSLYASFSNEESFIAYWLDLLYEKNQECYFFIDKNKIFAPILLKMKNKPVLISIFHSVHTRNPQDILVGDFNSNYRNILNNPTIFKTIIVSTQQQKNDLVLRFGDIFSINVIPPSYAKKRKRISIIERNKNRIISVGRYYVEKRLDHMIKAISIVKNNIPNVQLDLYGFGDARDNYKTEKELRNLIQELKLEDNVFLRGYSTDILREIETSTISLITSSIEGFCIAILDSLSCGTPVISYDIKYGPSDLIKNDINGYLIKDSDINSLAQKIESLLTDPDQYQYLSQEAYNSINYYSDIEVKNLWKNFIRSFK